MVNESGTHLENQYLFNEKFIKHCLTDNPRRRATLERRSAKIPELDRVDGSLRAGMAGCAGREIARLSLTSCRDGEVEIAERQMAAKLGETMGAEIEAAAVATIG